MRAIIIISTFFLGGLACGQSSTRLYVYSQDFTPGMVPGRQSENGIAPSAPKTRTRYFVYFSQSFTEKSGFEKIRVGEQWFLVSKVDTVKTPYYSDEPIKKLLVGKTGNKVLQLQLGEPCPAPAGYSKTAVAASTAGLTYKRKGRTYSITARIIKLPSVHGL